MDSEYAMLGGDLDVCRMFDQYSYKVRVWIFYQSSVILLNTSKKINFQLSRILFWAKEIFIASIKNLLEQKLF